MKNQLMAFRLFLLLGFTFFLGCGPNMPEEVEIAYENLPEIVDFNFHDINFTDIKID